MLTREGIVLRGGASSKRQALHIAAEAAAQMLGRDVQQVFSALMEREAEREVEGGTIPLADQRPPHW